MENIKNDWISDKSIPNGKRAVLLAGLALFSAQGFDNTSTSELAAEAQVSEATIYKYFKTKRDLLLAIIDPMIANFIPKSLSSLQLEIKEIELTLDSFIHFFVQNRWDFLKQNHEAIQILITEILTDSTIKQLFIETMSNYTPFLKNILLHLLKQNNKLNPKLTAADFARTIIGFLLTYFMQVNLFSVEAIKTEEQTLITIEMQIIRALT
ncbi:TetR/AcrR family transcriptional regulator [Dellaglioa sp. BT-FLS60]